MSFTSKTTNIPLITNSGNFETFNCDINDSDFFQNLLFLFGDKKFSDVTLTDASGETQVRAHRLILSARSEYFSTMFDSSFKEAESKEVKFEDIDGKTLQMVINFMYSNTIDLEGDTVENVIKAAHLLQIKPLEVVCCDYFQKQVEACNVLGVLLFADQYNITTLCEYAYEFASNSFMELRHHEEFFLLDAHQLSNFISSDNLRVFSEEDVFNGMLAWVHHDRERREQFFEELFQHIRLTLLSPEFITSTVEPAIKSSKSKDLIAIAHEWHLLPELRQSLVPKLQIQRRNFNDVFVAIDGWENNECNLRVAFYSNAAKEWSYRECPRPTEKRIKFAFASMNEKLYIAGGLMANKQVSKSVDCLDLKTFQWTQLPPLLTARFKSEMTVLNGQLYIVGGQYFRGNSTAGLRSVEKWDPLIGAWEYIPPMSREVWYPIVGVKGSTLCVATYDLPEKKLHIYDPLTMEWTYGWSRAPQGLLGMATISINRVDHFFTISNTQIKDYTLGNNNINIIPVSCKQISYYNKSALFNDTFIIKLDGGFTKYFFIENKWESMPDFDGAKPEFLVLISRPVAKVTPYECLKW